MSNDYFNRASVGRNINRYWLYHQETPEGYIYPDGSIQSSAYWYSTFQEAVDSLNNYLHPTEKIYPRGTIFNIWGQKYILAMVGTSEFCLINLKNGNRYHDYYRCEVIWHGNDAGISEKNLKKMLDGDEKWEIVKE